MRMNTCVALYTQYRQPVKLMKFSNEIKWMWFHFVAVVVAIASDGITKKYAIVNIHWMLEMGECVCVWPNF